MDNGLVIILPNIIILALFVLFLWWRHSLNIINWVTYAAMALGIILLALVISLIVLNQSVSGILLALLIAIPVFIFIVFLLFMTRIITVENLKSRFHFDERITTMNTKSARNALVAIFLSSVIYLLIYSNINHEMFLGILGTSIVVYIASMVIYYFRSF